MISLVYWLKDGSYAFQMVDGYWRVYDSEGDFVQEFDSFEAMDNWLYKQRRVLEK